MRKHCLIFLVIIALIALAIIIFMLCTRITSGTGPDESPAEETEESSYFNLPHVDKQAILDGLGVRILA